MTTNKVTTNVIKNDDRVKAEKAAAENLKKQTEQAKKEAEAKALVDALAGQVTGAYNVDDIVTKTLIKLGTHYQVVNNDADKNNDLSAEQIKLAQKYIKSKAFEKAQKSALNDYARLELMKIAGNDEKVNATKSGKVKNQVQAELERKYKNKEITKAEYEFLKKESKTAGSFWEFFGIRKNKDVARVYNVTANTNNRDQRQAELTSGTDAEKGKAFDKYFSAEMEAKLEQRGLTPEKLYEIYNANGCAADATANYSFKQKQPGEQHAILAALNNGRKDGEYEFTMSDAKEIAKGLANKWEKAIDPAKVVRDAGAGAVVGSPLWVVSKSNSASKAGNNTANSSGKIVLPLGSIIGTGVGAAASAYEQYTRVEDRAIPDGVFKDVTTYEEYAKNLDQYATKEGASLGKQIGKYYVKDGVFLKDQLEKDLHHSAGTDRADQTPLNYEEATGLLAELASGKKVIKAPEKPVEKTEEVVVVNTENKTRQVDQAFCGHTVEKGDNPWAYAYHLYGAKNNAENKAVRAEIQKLVKKSDANASFWKVGVQVELPEEITVNVNGQTKTFKINCDEEFDYSDQVSTDFTGKSASSAAKLDKVDEDYEEASADVYTVKGQQRTHKENLYKGESETTAKSEAEKYKEENDNDKNKVTIEIK